MRKRLGVLLGVFVLLGKMAASAGAVTTYTITDLGAFIQSGCAGESRTLAINNNGQVVGQAAADNGRYHAFMYDGIMHDLGDLGSGYSYAYKINNVGQVVGESYITNSNQYFARHAFIWQNGNMSDLNSLVPPGTDWGYLSQATDINDSGQIVGFGILKTGQTHAFLLKPTPEPSSLLALASGLSAFGGMLLRRRK